MKEQIQEHRMRLFAILLVLQELPSSRENSVVKTKIEETRMLMGTMLGRIGTPNPYPDSKDASNMKVEKATDTDVKPFNFTTTEPVTRYKELRAEVTKLKEGFETTMLSKGVPLTQDIAEHRTFFLGLNIELGLSLVCNWLGMAMAAVNSEKAGVGVSDPDTKDGAGSQTTNDNLNPSPTDKKAQGSIAPYEMGDVVVEKNGGTTKMTVSGFNGSEMVICTWQQTEGDTTPKTAEFNFLALEYAPAL